MLLHQLSPRGGLVQQQPVQAVWQQMAQRALYGSVGSNTPSLAVGSQYTAGKSLLAVR